MIESEMKALKRQAFMLETILVYARSEDINEHAKEALIKAASELSSQIKIIVDGFRWDSAKDEVYVDDIPF